MKSNELVSWKNTEHEKHQLIYAEAITAIGITYTQGE